MSQQQISFLVTVKKGRPDISLVPKDTPKGLVELMECCWDHDPNNRPDFNDITNYLRKFKF